MRATIRRNLSMAMRALNFEREHPASDESHIGIVDRLAQLLDQAETLRQRMGSGDDGERAARTRRRSIRSRIRERLRHLAQVADVASRTTPALEGKYVAPRYNGPNQEFMSAARRLLESATADQQLLLSAGLGATFATDLAAAIAEFDQVSDAADDARGEHVGARAQLQEITREVLSLLKVLDGLNSVRLAGEAGLLAEWTSARNVFGPINRSGSTATEEPAPDGDAPPPEVQALPVFRQEAA